MWAWMSLDEKISLKIWCFATFFKVKNIISIQKDVKMHYQRDRTGRIFVI